MAEMEAQREAGAFPEGNTASRKKAARGKTGGEKKGIRRSIGRAVLLLAAGVLSAFFLYSGYRQYRAYETKREILSAYPVQEMTITQLRGADQKLRDTFVMTVDTDFTAAEKVRIEAYLSERYGSDIFIFYE